MESVDVGALQERAARAVPAAVEDRREGAWLRLTDSPATWWAGAALLHGAGDVPTRVDLAERFYAGHGATALLQVCPACPPSLDAELARRGYRRGGDVSLQVAAAGDVAGTSPTPTVRLSDQPSPEWVDLLVAAQGPTADPAGERRLLQRVTAPSAYATAVLDGRPVAVGRAVSDAGWTGVFGMATLPAARSRGAAGAVLAALAGWAVECGAPRMYLQVTADSTAALRLYRRAGFLKAATYHYRTAVS